MPRQRGDQRRIVHVAAMHEPDALELLRQPCGIGRQFAAGERKPRRMRPCRRIARASSAGCVAVQSTIVQPIVAGELVERLRARREQRTRQGLRLVEDDDAAGDVVQLAAARGARGEQAFEELHVGGDDDGRGPVLHGELELVPVGLRAVRIAWSQLASLVLDGRMMFEHDVVAEHFAKDRGGLVDDRGEGDGVDDPLVPVRLGVIESEGERGERLAAAGRHRRA